MTSADIMIRSDSTFTDPCSRITNDNQDNNSEVDEVDFIVVGGGVAGNKYSILGTIRTLEIILKFSYDNGRNNYLWNNNALKTYYT